MTSPSIRQVIPFLAGAIAALLTSSSQAGTGSTSAELPYSTTAYTEAYRGQFHFIFNGTGLLQNVTVSP